MQGKGMPYRELSGVEERRERRLGRRRRMIQGG